MTKSEIFQEKMADITPEEKPVIDYILEHGNPQRSEILDQFRDNRNLGNLARLDEILHKALKVGVITLDAASYRYSIAPHFRELTGPLRSQAQLI